MPKNKKRMYCDGLIKTKSDLFSFVAEGTDSGS